MFINHYILYFIYVYFSFNLKFYAFVTKIYSVWYSFSYFQSDWNSLKKFLECSEQSSLFL